MYNSVYLDERVALTPIEISSISSAESIGEMLTKKLREKHEGKCNANGYVKPGSLSILARSMGVAENGRFTGNLLYDCKIKCDVFYPIGGAEIEATVIKVNKMGAYVHYDEAIRILLPRDLHVGNVEFDSIEEDKVVRVRLERSRFQTNDSYIMGVGVLLGRVMPTPTTRRSKKNSAKKTPTATLPAPSAEEEEAEEAAGDEE
jgi:DNA-directed RNA polymerase subunit E'/Rpb7